MPHSVAEWCREKNVDVDALATRSGLDSTRVEAIVLGRWTPSPAERRTIAEALGTTVDEIAWGHVTPIQHLYGHGPG
jgi:hypothetical protein